MMHLDRATCRRARLARDARFDGRFFVAVRTTGVFCRPICPAVPPSERNVAYFPTAAAAAEAGFRACLRCRPECAPGTPAWAGVTTTVGRALRLIADAGAEGESVEALAEHLGVGARHLRRLFVEHLGATPVAVIQTRRLLSAKRLIDDTDLPLTRVAMAAGFGSIRRFNAAFLGSYGRSPRRLREAKRRKPGGATGPQAGSPRYSFQLHYRPPFDWDALLAFLGARAIPGVEAVQGGVYRRSIERGGQCGWFEVAPSDARSLRLDIEFPDPSHLLFIVSRVRRLFDLDADPMLIDAHLADEALLAPLVQRQPGLRVPGCWDGFELAVRAVLGQQVSVQAATTLSGRLVAALGRPLDTAAGDTPSGAGAPPGLTHLFPSASAVAAANIAALGVPGARAEALRCLARAVADGQISLRGDMDPGEVRERLRGLRGVGDWTAEYVALRALADPDAFPSGDLGLLRATGLKSARQLAERSKAWQPWRAYAAMHLWLGARG